MKKTTLAALAAALLIAAVLCTAGCVEAPSHQTADGPAAETAIASPSQDELYTAPYTVLDMDPGCDDVFACFLAAKALTEPDMYIASAGNAPRTLTSANLAVIDTYLGLNGKTALGAEKTLPGFDVEYDGFNGADGLGNIADLLAEACGFTASEYQFDYQNIEEIADELMRHDSVTYILTGPASTLAQLLILEPELKNHIGKALVMGGGLEIVNTPENTEYNFKGDMAALSVLLQSGIQVVVFPLDITVPYYVSKEDIAELKAAGAYPEMTMILEYLASVSGNGNYRNVHPEYAWESTPYPFPEGAVALHDAFPVLYAWNPEMFTLSEKTIRIDASLQSNGRVSVKEPGFSVYVAEEMKDRNYIRDLLLKAYTAEEAA